MKRLFLLLIAAPLIAQTLTGLKIADDEAAGWAFRYSGRVDAWLAAVVVWSAWFHFDGQGWQETEPSALELRPELHGQDATRWRYLEVEFDGAGQPAIRRLEARAPLRYEIAGEFKLADPQCHDNRQPGELYLCVLQPVSQP